MTILHHISCQRASRPDSRREGLRFSPEIYPGPFKLLICRRDRGSRRPEIQPAFRSAFGRRSSGGPTEPHVSDGRTHLPPGRRCCL